MDDESPDMLVGIALFGVFILVVLAIVMVSFSQGV